MLNVDSLAVSFRTRMGRVDAVRDVSFTLARGEKLGVVGESGSGKSVMSYAVMQILDIGGQIRGGRIVYRGTDLLQGAETTMHDVRGREIAMIFQNPRAALNPIRKVGLQIEDALRRHKVAARSDARAKAMALLDAVRIRRAEDVYSAYPHELSGGMCQRVVIAIALACNPQLLIADEPTTGLDITTQKAVMDLVADLISSRRMSAILITHDLALAASYCDRLLVMKDGQVVESGTAMDVFTTPAHSYTRRLVSATPGPGTSVRSLLDPHAQAKEQAQAPEPTIAAAGDPLIQVRNLCRDFSSGQTVSKAVDNISFDIRTGESVGLVGESGCGKSTTSAMLMKLLPCSSGEILYRGEDIAAIPVRRFAKDPRRAALQMVFQDATDSLNPRHTAEQAIAEPLCRLTTSSRTERATRVREVCELVSLPAALLGRYPHQLSGGQKARVGIARAIAVRPELLILDEPTAALDVSIQAIVLNLLVDLRAELGISYLFISHDLRVVRLLCERVLVMQAGRLVECGASDQIMEHPTHPYTQQLLAAAPDFKSVMSQG